MYGASLLLLFPRLLLLLLLTDVLLQYGDDSLTYRNALMQENVIDLVVEYVVQP